MRKALAILGLALMATGLIFTAFGTQQVSVSEVFGTCQGRVCQATIEAVACETGSGICRFTLVPLSTAQTAQPSFTLNYIGVFLAVLGSIFFATLYSKRPSSSLPISALSFGF